MRVTLGGSSYRKIARPAAVASLVAAVAAAATLVPAQRAGAELIGFYPFEGDANDASGNGNHGTVLGNAAITAAGYQGQAYDFTGAGGTADAGISVPINIDPTAIPELTFGAFVNADAVGNTVRGIIGHDNGGFDRGLGLDFRGDASGDIRYSGFTGTGVVAAGPDPAPPGEWVFIAARYSASSGTVTLDVGDQRVTVAANPGDGQDVTRIGRNPSFDTTFDGRIDNVFFFNEILSDARIDAIRANGASAIVPEPAGLGALAIGALILGRRRRAAR